MCTTSCEPDERHLRVTHRTDLLVNDDRHPGIVPKEYEAINPHCFVALGNSRQPLLPTPDPLPIHLHTKPLHQSLHRRTRRQRGQEPAISQGLALNNVARIRPRVGEEARAVEDLRDALDVGGLEGRVGAGAAVEAALAVFFEVEVEVAGGGLVGEGMGECEGMGKGVGRGEGAGDERRQESYAPELPIPRATFR